MNQSSVPQANYIVVDYCQISFIFGIYNCVFIKTQEGYIFVKFRQIACIVVVCSMLFVSGCSYFISSQATQFADNLSLTIKNSDDPGTIADALPAYILLLDSMLQQQPGNVPMLLAASELNNAYVNLLGESDSERARKVTRKSLDYATRAVCLQDDKTCGVLSMKYEAFLTLIQRIDTGDLPLYFSLGSAWASWISANRDDWNAIAQLAQVKAVMQRTIELDAHYQQGDAYMYLGVMESLVPPAMGGKPDVAKQYFDNAVEIGGNKNLIIKVAYARYYAKLMFDRDLHDRLLDDVITADGKVQDLTLSNTVAKKMARELLAQADEYF